MTKLFENSDRVQCYICNQNLKKGSFRTLKDLICITCERKKYGFKNKLPKLNKKSKPKKLETEKVTSFGGVYQITCFENNKVYIGESSNLRRRKENYILRNGYINPILLQDIDTYGLENFDFTVLAVMKGSSKEDRIQVEAYYKSKYTSGELYNILQGKESKEEYEKWKANQ